MIDVFSGEIAFPSPYSKSKLLFFTVYRVSSLLEKKYEDANQQDNNTAVSADKSIENNSTPKGYDNITGVNILPKDNYTPAVNYAPVMQENIYTSNDNNSNVINSLSDLNKDDKSIANPYDDLDNMLYDAAVKGDFESVRRYIDMGANINSVDSSGSTIIYRMSLLKNLSMDQMNCLNYLLLKGADANKENYNGYTPLTAHFSSNLFNKEFLDRLLQNNAEINSPDFDGDTPLHFAVMNNNLVTLTEYIIKKLVVDEDSVSVKEFENDDESVMQIEVLISKNDMARVIGRDGRNINAIRTIVQASSSISDGKKININVDSY